MIVGVDFDNTIVCYTGVFHRVALECGLIPAEVGASKNSVRDYLQARGEFGAWTELQGLVYGTRMELAQPFPHVRECLLHLRQLGVKVHIISHKTRYAKRGTQHDLHASALEWLRAQRIAGTGDGMALAGSDVFLCETREAKIGRIQSLGCTHYVDDLPEVLLEDAFPPETDRLLLDPFGAHPDAPAYRRFGSWAEIRSYLDHAR